MRLVDTHAHIHDQEFSPDVREADAVLERALAAGISVIVTLGVNFADSRTAVEFASRHPGHVFAGAGVHPHDAKDATDADLDELARLASHPSVAIIGEIGLDYYRNFSSGDQQQRVMRKQLLTAKHVGKPIAVHAREAHHEMLPLLTEYSRELGGRLPDGRPLGVMHYFSADVDHAQRYIELGYLISIHTSVTHPKATQLQDVARAVPLEYLVLETDSPYGAPQRHRGKRNEPAYVVEAAACVAELKGVQVEQVATVTTRNAERLLGLAVASSSGSRA